MHAMWWILRVRCCEIADSGRRRSPSSSVALVLAILKIMLGRAVESIQHDALAAEKRVI